ncbi:hypothetical protein SRHO_G00207540 [Serrasalmus rhombeus]
MAAKSSKSRGNRLAAESRRLGSRPAVHPFFPQMPHFYGRVNLYHILFSLNAAVHKTRRICTPPPPAHINLPFQQGRHHAPHTVLSAFSNEQPPYTKPSSEKPPLVFLLLPLFLVLTEAETLKRFSSSGPLDYVWLSQSGVQAVQLD